MATTQSPAPARQGPTSGPQVRTARRSRWLDSTSSRLLLESTLIVLSVLIGFALSEWGSRRADRAHAAAALENFRRELRENLSALERIQPSHALIAERLAGVADSDTDGGETGFDVLAAAMPEDGYDPPDMREAAWQTAGSTGALRLLDYEVAALLSETYLVQASIIAATQRMDDRLSDESNFDPQARNAMIRVWHRLFSDLASQEEYLIERYRVTLQDLPTPAPR